MVKIPGVGRKTANVILGNAFGAMEGFIVDTHIERLAQRFGWSHQKDAVNIEQDLMRLLPRQEWLDLAHRMNRSAALPYTQEVGYTGQRCALCPFPVRWKFSIFLIVTLPAFSKKSICT